jgi:hypothetical protein
MWCQKGRDMSKRIPVYLSKEELELLRLWSRTQAYTYGLSSIDINLAKIIEEKLDTFQEDGEDE